jgi:hypothetical protein
VVAGSGGAKLDDAIVELSVWDVLRVAPPVVRSFEAGPEGLDMICIGGRKPKGGDTERFEDVLAVIGSTHCDEGVRVERQGRWKACRVLAAHLRHSRKAPLSPTRRGTAAVRARQPSLRGRHSERVGGEAVVGLSGTAQEIVIEEHLICWRLISVVG